MGVEFWIKWVVSICSIYNCRGFVCSFCCFVQTCKFSARPISITTIIKIGMMIFLLISLQDFIKDKWFPPTDLTFQTVTSMDLAVVVFTIFVHQVLPGLQEKCKVFLPVICRCCFFTPSFPFSTYSLSTTQCQRGRLRIITSGIINKHAPQLVLTQMQRYKGQWFVPFFSCDCDLKKSLWQSYSYTWKELLRLSTASWTASVSFWIHSYIKAYLPAHGLISFS